jgi:NADH:ubiquinone oxidoreductase subunit 2 (subunit N)
LAIIMTVNTMISFYYYLRVAFMMFRDTPERETAQSGPPPSLPFMGAAALAALTLSLVWIGVYPGPLVQTIRSMVAGLR